jgi:hypothetical protein
MLSNPRLAQRVHNFFIPALRRPHHAIKTSVRKKRDDGGYEEDVPLARSAANLSASDVKSGSELVPADVPMWKADVYSYNFTKDPSPAQPVPVRKVTKE